MILCHTKQWGNSLGIIIPAETVRQHELKAHEDILIDIKGRVNVLKELFGTLKFRKSTAKLLVEAQKELESRL